MGLLSNGALGRIWGGVGRASSWAWKDASYAAGSVKYGLLGSAVGAAGGAVVGGEGNRMSGAARGAGIGAGLGVAGRAGWGMLSPAAKETIAGAAYTAKVATTGGARRVGWAASDMWGSARRATGSGVRRGAATVRNAAEDWAGNGAQGWGPGAGYGG